MIPIISSPYLGSHMNFLYMLVLSGCISSQGEKEAQNLLMESRYKEALAGNNNDLVTFSENNPSFALHKASYHQLSSHQGYDEKVVLIC